MRSPQFQARHLYAACFSILLSHHLAACGIIIRCLAQALPEGIEQELGTEVLAAHAWGKTRESWKQEWDVLFPGVDRKQDGVSSRLA